MSRKPFKRIIDLCDDSPNTSSPLQPPIKRRHVESDASSDFFDSRTPSTPSDSPSNPFGKCRLSKTRPLPRATSIDDHLVLRFQLLSDGHSVFRIATVPMNYTFWHLSNLIQFLFGWKGVRRERDPYNKHLKIERKVEHIFSIQKDIVLFTTAQRVGIVKRGRTAAYIAGDDIKDIRLQMKEDVRFEHEQRFTLQHLWSRRGQSTKAIIYDYDFHHPNCREVVHITMCGEFEKLSGRCFDGLSNKPFVLKGAGLPDDDDDDEDLALDLQQWNEPNAFEDFLKFASGEKSLDDSDEELDSAEMQRRIAEEQAKVRKRLMAPLPPEKDKKRTKGKKSAVQEEEEEEEEEREPENEQAEEDEDLDVNVEEAEEEI